LTFLTQNKAKFGKILIITLVFEKNAFFAENCRKSQKIVIITSTPDRIRPDHIFWYKYALFENIELPMNVCSVDLTYELSGSN
jgi:hypothetical protein